MNSPRSSRNRNTAEHSERICGSVHRPTKARNLPRILSKLFANFTKALLVLGRLAIIVALVEISDEFRIDGRSRSQDFFDRRADPFCNGVRSYTVKVERKPRSAIMSDMLAQGVCPILSTGMWRSFANPKQ
jgi:hypothetical protein